MTGFFDWDTLRRTIYGEARNQPYAGLLAVGWVVKNRLARRWGKVAPTISDICTQHLQFSCWNKNDPNRETILRATDDIPEFLRCSGAAAEVLLGVRPDPTNGADHYFTVDKPKGARVWPPAWAASMTHTATIGGHIFYKE